MEKEREERIAEAEIENLTGARHLESQKLASLLAARHLEIKQIPSDGHCMYRAIEDQLRDHQNSWTVATLRNQTAKYMQSHFDDFLPFLTNPNTGEMYSRGKTRGVRDFKNCCNYFWLFSISVKADLGLTLYTVLNSVTFLVQLCSVEHGIMIHCETLCT